MRTILKTLYSWKLATLLPFLFFFALSHTYAQERTLRWDADTSNDKIAGYYLYYGNQSRYPTDPDPYKGTEAAEGPSPIPIPNKDTKEYTLTGLNDTKVYFFAVKAYDNNNAFSFFSNEEITLGIRWPGGGFYVNDEPGSPNYSSQYTIRGRADNGAVISLVARQNSTQTPLGTATADVNRDWSKDVDFSQFSEGPVILAVESGGISPPDVTATYDPTDPTSQATSATDTGSFVAITWSASDATSGVASTQLWCKPPAGSWGDTGLSQGGASGTFYYYPPQGDGEYFFATRSVDRAGNWEAGPNGDGDTSTQYIAPSGAITGKEGGGGGCFITTAAPEKFQALAN